MKKTGNKLIALRVPPELCEVVSAKARLKQCSDQEVILGILSRSFRMKFIAPKRGKRKAK